MFDGLMPYTVVKNEQFKSFINSLSSKFSVPSEKVIRTKMMPKLYKDTQCVLLDLLKEALGSPYFVITSSQTLDSYLGLTQHFLTLDFKRKMVVLRCLPYNSAHTGESIRNRVEFILESWGLSLEKLHLVVSASNMRTAFENWDRASCKFLL